VLGLDPTFPLKYMVYFLLVVAIGGAGTIKGGLVAALVLGICDVGGKYYVPQVGSFIILFPDGRADGRVSVRPLWPARVSRLPDDRWRRTEIAFWLLPIAASSSFPSTASRHARS
jgi:hypothetical protein